jgi:hypothetical protein
MALFGSDRPVMPTFKTAPDPDSSARSPYDDLNRLERNGDRDGERNNDRNNDGSNDRNGERNAERNGDRSPERNPAHQLDRADERNAAELRAQDRAQDRLERVLDRNGRELDRNPDQRPERSHDRGPGHVPATAVQLTSRKSAEGTDPLIQGLFSKLPEPSTAWPLPARQKWLQTAANIFDLMYPAGEADAGELAIRVERTSTRQG